MSQILSGLNLHFGLIKLVEVALIVWTIFLYLK